MSTKYRGRAAATLALSMVISGVAQAVTPPPSIALASSVMPAQASQPSADGSFLVTITLNVNLAGLDPSAVSGTWLCSARAMSKPSVDREIAKINALGGQAAKSEYGSALEYRAHYLGQQASVAFPIAGGGYGGSQSITIKVGRDDLVDPATKRSIEQPGVFVGCWLSLANALGQTTVAYQVAKPMANSNPLVAIAQVRSPPYFLASASVSND